MYKYDNKHQKEIALKDFTSKETENNVIIFHTILIETNAINLLKISKEKRSTIFIFQGTKL